MNDFQYNKWLQMSDIALAETIGSFIRHHRLQQNKTQAQIAEQANISRSTLSLLEKGKSVTLPTLLQVLRVLGQLNIMEAFEITSEISPIEYARLKESKQRYRARPKKSNKAKNDDLGW